MCIYPVFFFFSLSFAAHIAAQMLKLLVYSFNIRGQIDEGAL